MPPDACGEGFATNDQGSCEAMLPAGICPKGKMAIPGEMAWHEIASCGTGDYGDIPVDPATTQFVKNDYPGQDSDGSQAKPWKTIQEGIDAAAPGAIVAVAAGSYPEDVFIDQKPVILWGRCPSLVEVAGSFAGNHAASMGVYNPETSQAEIHALAIRGLTSGIVVSGPSAVVIDRVWVHDTGYTGIVIDGKYGPTSASVRAAVIEGSHVAGVWVNGADGVLDGVVVRDTQLDDEGQIGLGVAVTNDAEAKVRGQMTVTRSIIESSHTLGVQVMGSDATLEGVVVRNTQSSGVGTLGWGIGVRDDDETRERSHVIVRGSVVEQNRGRGVAVIGADATLEGVTVNDTQPSEDSQLGIGVAVYDNSITSSRAEVTLRASVVEQNHGLGVAVFGSNATLDGVTVRNTQLDGNGQLGWGIVIGPDAETKERAKVTVRASVAEQNRGAGVANFGSEVTLEGVAIRKTLPDGEGLYGIGIEIQDDSTTRAQAVVRASVVEENQESGISSYGSDVTLEGVVVRNTLPNGDGQKGRGISIQQSFTSERSNATLRGVLVEGNREAGVVVIDSNATIAAVRVHDTAAQDDKLFGDGLSVISNDGLIKVAIIDSEVASNGRAGVANWGATVSLVESVTSCNVFDINTEVFNEHRPSWDGSKHYLCGCGNLSDQCTPWSTGISPPGPLMPLPPPSSPGP